jgi:hypothetical protein
MKLKNVLFLMSAMLVLTLSSFGQNNSSSDITRSVDDFTGKITLKSPNSKSMTIYKMIRNDQVHPFLDTVYYLRLETTGLTCVVDGDEAIVLFTDGTKWNKSEKIECEVGDGDYYNYSAFIRLSPDDLNLFTTKTISKFKLYIFESKEISPLPEEFITYVNKIKRMK